ncbi:MAG: hypothetical protein ACR2PJ_03020 [Pseudomonadales bacterium]
MKSITKSLTAIGVLALLLTAAGCQDPCYDPDSVWGEPNRENWVEVDCGGRR